MLESTVSVISPWKKGSFVLERFEA